MKKVCIIVPVFNEEKHLKTCLNSLVNQTLKDIEIIAIDDNSTDNSLNILMNYSKKYNQIKVYQNLENKGQGATRNIGLSLANAEYIGFLDADDYVNYKMYEEMYKKAIENNYPSIISTNLKFVKDDNYIKTNFNYPHQSNSYLYSPAQSPSNILNESPSCCNKLFESALIKKYKFLENTLWEDFAFTYVNLIKSPKVLNINSLDYFYRKDITSGVSSTSYKPTKHIYDIFTVADEIIKQAIKTDKYKIFDKQIKFLIFTICLQRIKEINSWPNSQLVKENLYEKIYEKYGELFNIDESLLSARVDINTIKEFKQKIKTKFVK
ncbi:MAG: glycosyltransferase family 2 protein [Bacilli bacterium]|nr:glycosyltransferase family 2 protein [Bacilli bacterium]